MIDHAIDVVVVVDHVVIINDSPPKKELVGDDDDHYDDWWFDVVVIFINDNLSLQTKTKHNENKQPFERVTITIWKRHVYHHSPKRATFLHRRFFAEALGSKEIWDNAEVQLKVVLGAFFSVISW